MAARTVFFIHGNFVNHECWNLWVNRFESKGYNCIAVSYPGRHKPVAQLRQEHPDPAMAQVSLEEVIAHYVRLIQQLDEPPIIIGHSFGGLLTQLMVNRGLGAAAVAVDSVPPPGVLTFKWSFYKSLLPVLNPLSSSPWLMPFEHFQYTFVNGMAYEDQRRAYDLYVTPESLRLSRGGVTSTARIDFKKPHAPLLMIGGEIDHIMPASLNRTNAARYSASPSVIDYKEFAGRNHFTVIGGEGWEEVADYALDWAERHASGNTRPEKAAAAD